ncbi:hypothetical protein HanXRQr2_Chr06g0273841 [Helianthus annuus]|uniref:DUF4283 domain-containing protein n=1 Tax=Helianthus annuus TaxID=4232 RepID=A0A9K3IV82_HELAN|nr:hypothetical protein HanXRQr2_Chr06g0273841 [Helianthus annuus]KAJ0574628.1 hypothetical protein HanHA89_Chr06g0240371 [Helianthus annuus]KAJ0738958.1 hypothetical protein HanLR1_Chr06g0224271 [Helianthus annuus]
MNSSAFSVGGGLSFSQMVRKGMGTSVGDPSTSEYRERPKELEIQEETRAFPDLHGRDLIGRASDVTVLRKLKEACVEEGLGGFGIVYIGGLSVCLKFQNSEEASSMLLRHDTWKKWFTNLDIWEGQVLLFERIAWIKIHGVLIHLAENWVFDYVAGQFGSVVHPAQLDTSDVNSSVVCVGILVREGKKIEDSVTLKWKNIRFKVWVVEECGDWDVDSLRWVPVRVEDKPDGISSGDIGQSTSVPVTFSPIPATGGSGRQVEREEGELQQSEEKEDGEIKSPSSKE